MDEPVAKASQWLAALLSPDAAYRTALRGVYGDCPEVLAERRRLLQRTLGAFLDSFGDGPVRVFRSPGRINLRGMHVDTHGGYLNLMTLHREVVIAVRAAASGMCRVANVDPMHPPVAFDLAEDAADAAYDGPWYSFISASSTRARSRAMGWGAYARGSLVRASWNAGRPQGADMMVGGDIPEGSGLSSSSALCTAAYMAARALMGEAETSERTILAVRDAEWYAGARIGVSDQAAMVLGGPDTLVRLALYPPELDTSNAERHPFAQDLAVLVINSFTRRSLSGLQAIAYARNRFAYSLALDVLRRHLVEAGAPSDAADQVDRLSRLTPEALKPYAGDGDGLRLLYRLLMRAPETVTLEEVRARYGPQGLDAAYEMHFGSVPEAERPTVFNLRGPLVYGVAESERARIFADALAGPDPRRAGRLMCLGHDGDRAVRPDGTPYACPVDDARLRELCALRVPISDVPGSYGASSPALDYLVDAAVAAGSLGASLTGAGIAGCAIALCRRRDLGAIVPAVEAALASERYALLAGFDRPPGRMEPGVEVHRSIAGAGELPLPAGQATDAAHRPLRGNSPPSGW